MLKNNRFLISFIAFSAVMTLIFGVQFAMVQQSIRMGANDPQIQMAEDAALGLSGWKVPADVVPQETIDISGSLSPFIMVFDNNGTVLESSGRLYQFVPIPPKGILDYAKIKGENRLTWQPEKNVRIATVVVPYNSGTKSGYVLVGRSLREVEVRESQSQNITLVGWFVSLLIGFISLYYSKK